MVPVSIKPPLAKQSLARRLLLGAAAAVGLMVAPQVMAKPAHKPLAPAAGPAAPTPPRLLVAIAVDQFSADLFAQYRQHFTGGFARLLQGAVFPSAFQSHAATETCPGHSTLLTGVHPARSGIIANNWYDLSLPRADQRVYCAEEEKDPNSTPREPVVSAGHLRVPTLGERMKAQWPASRNVAVSGKDRAVMMMGGHLIDEAYWFQGRGFSTLSGRTMVGAALGENTKILALLRKGAPALVAPDWCRARARPVKAGDAVIGVGRFALAADEADQFRLSPRLDAATLDLAEHLVTDMQLGKGPAPDMLSVSLSATDYIGHGYGHQGEEMCVQMAQLDQALGAFFAKLDAAGLDYAVVLTADHGGLDTPERLVQQALPGAGRVDVELSARQLSYAIARQLNLADYLPKPEVPGAPPAPQLVYAESLFGDYFVRRDLPAETRAKVIETLIALVRQHPQQVAAVFTHDEIARTPVPAGSPQDWSLIERARLSFDAERSGDVYIVLNRAVVPIAEPHPGITATHGSPWDYDRRVPLVFWRKGLAGMEQPAPVETVDIAPTLSALIGLKVPQGAYDGRCLDIDGGPGNSCGK